MSITAEIEGKRIAVYFPYDEELIRKIRLVLGSSFVKKPFKHWTVPLDMAACHKLREVYGEELNIGDDLREWAWKAKRTEGQLGKIALSESGELKRLPRALPSTFRALYLGPLGKTAIDNGITPEEIDIWMNVMSAWKGCEPWDPRHGSYQTADVRFMADSKSPLNGNQQGLGKTIETIAAIWEAGIEEGAHLIIAPSAAVDAVWPDELELWQKDMLFEVEIFPVMGSRKKREQILEKFAASTARVRWLIVNPQMVQYVKQENATVGKFGRLEKIKGNARRAKPKDWMRACHCDRLKDPHWHYKPRYDLLFETDWRTITIDEAHKGNVRNHRSLTSFSIEDLPAPEKKMVLTGTPMKKKGGSDIWGILHWLRPDVFTSFWRFADMFFDIEENRYGKKIGELLPERQEDFFNYLTPYLLRRTKAECIPWLPEKMIVPVWVTIDPELFPRQHRQYLAMQEEAATSLEDGNISANGVLAEITRLRQFANAYCKIDSKGKVVPTLESAKLEALWQKFEEDGIFDGGGTQHCIFSQSREMVDLVATELGKRGVTVGVISGQNRPGQRKTLRNAFQAGTIRVLCIVTTAGGVALTLDAADTAHFIDESYAPDDQEQAEDRIHRASRIHQVTIYVYRSRDTIDEDVMVTAIFKQEAHKHILDARRKLLARVDDK